MGVQHHLIRSHNDAKAGDQLNNLVTYSVKSSSPFKKFAIFDVNENAMNGVIQRHRKDHPLAQIIKCSCEYSGPNQTSKAFPTLCTDFDFQLLQRLPPTRRIS